MHEGGGRWVGSNKVVELKKKRETMETFSQKLHLLQGSNLLDAAADGISQLNPIPHLKTIGGSMACLMLILYVFFSVST